MEFDIDSEKLTAPEILEGDLSEEVAEIYLRVPELAVDLEMMGLNPHRDRLCLVQMMNREGRAVFVKAPHKPCRQLKRVLENRRLLKIFHFARLDVAFLLNWLTIDTKNIYCTRTASRLVRTYADSHGLKDVVLELLGVSLDKSVKHTDWASDVLTPEQIRYALRDVAFMIPLYDRLEAMLKREGRSELASRCFEVIPTFSRLDLLGFDRVFDHH